MDSLLQLAERCEAAEAGDTALDKTIAEALGWTMLRWWCDDGVEDFDWRAPDGRIHPWHPFFTRSLDAAMMLKEGVGVLITLSEIKGDGMPYCVIGNPETAELFEAAAATPALALVAAALRARHSQGVSDNG